MDRGRGYGLERPTDMTEEITLQTMADWARERLSEANIKVYAAMDRLADASMADKPVANRKYEDSVRASRVARAAADHLEQLAKKAAEVGQ